MIPHISQIPFQSFRMPSKGHPVFILRNFPGLPHYVVKKENFKKVFVGAYGSYKTYSSEQKRASLEGLSQSRDSFEFMLETFQVVTDHFPEIRGMDIFEVIAFSNKILAKNKHTQQVGTDFFKTQFEDDGDVTGSFWCIMDCLEGLYDLDGLMKHGAEEGSRQVLLQLHHNPSIWRNFGRVLAVDLFFGNTDRIGCSKTDRGEEDWYIVNHGNIFFVKTGVGDQIVMPGIDFFDPLKLWSNLHLSFASLDQDPLSPWQGRKLNRKKHAEMRSVLNILKNMFNDCLVRIDPAFELDGSVTNELHKGFVDGAKRLKKFLSKRKNKPQGVKDRKALIGW